MVFLLVVGAWLVKGAQGCDDNVLEDVVTFLWLFKAFSEEVGRTGAEFFQIFSGELGRTGAEFFQIYFQEKLVRWGQNFPEFPVCPWAL